MQDHNKTLNQYLKRSATLVAAFILLSFSANGHAVVLTTGCSESASCTLEELVAGGSLTVNDKIFENWSVDPDFDIKPDYSQIVVTGLDDGGNDPGPGLRYDLNGQVSWMNDEFTDEFYADWHFYFDVVTTEVSAFIKGASLTLIDFQIFESDFISEIEISEYIHGSFPHINPIQVPNLNDPLFASTSFGPYSRIEVETDLRINAYGQFGGASIETFEQRFSQTVIPVPPALWLFGSGLLGLVGLARRKAS